MGAMSASDPLLTRALLAHAEAEPGSLAFRFLDGPAPLDWDRGRLLREALAVAAWLQAEGAHGERVLLLVPQGPAFVAGFFGCLLAGAVAVPSYPVPHPKHAGRVHAIASDAGARYVLTDAATRALFAEHAAAFPAIAGARTLDLGAVDPAWAAAWKEPVIGPGTLAFLQYTSGSTGTPKGVMVRHSHLAANAAMMREGFGHHAGTRFMTWLPLFHDMGLIGNVIQSVYDGAPLALMAPSGFIRRPIRWLRAVSEFRATVSGGPNFAYDLCVAKTTPEEREGLDLSSWQAAFNGAEPIRPDTLARFVKAFAPHGLDPKAVYPCYGLAEATLFAAGSGRGQGPLVRAFDAAALEDRRALPSGEPSARPLASSGRSPGGQAIAIVDPESRRGLPAGRVGEIWLAGAHVAGGYWEKPEATAETFEAFTAGGEGPFLRTGDLGFLDAEGELFVSGRLKDLVIVRGRNLAPQDLELAAAQAAPALRLHATAAFAAADAAGNEAVAVAAEVDAAALPAEVQAELEAKVRRALAARFGVALQALRLLPPNAMPKTSSGKLQRQRCRALFEAGKLPALPTEEAAPV